MQVSVQPAGHGDGAPIDNTVDELAYVAAGNAAIKRSPQAGMTLALERAPYVGNRSVPRLITREPCLRHCPEAVGCGGSDMRRALALLTASGQNASIPRLG